MALSDSCLKLIAREAIPRLQNRRNSVCLGFPTVGATTELLERLFEVTCPTPTFKNLLTEIGFGENAVLDVSSYEDAELIADLNLPLPEEFPEFDFVVDNGTVEHCFNIGQAFLNVKRLTALGGVVFHNNPANWFGHGFWNINPCVYFDFYAANGFDVAVFLRDVATGNYQQLSYNPKLTEILPPRRIIIHAIATKTRIIADTFPTQERFAIAHRAASLTK